MHFDLHILFFAWSMFTYINLNRVSRTPRGEQDVCSDDEVDLRGRTARGVFYYREQTRCVPFS